MKKKWLIVPVVVGLLMLALVGGSAFAQSEDDDDSTLSSFAGKVASILGLDEDTVQDAMDQARQELRDEAVRARLNSLVEDGEITQDQADEYYEWYEDRPEGFPGGGFRGRGFGKSGRHGWHGRGFRK